MRMLKRFISSWHNVGKRNFLQSSTFTKINLPVSNLVHNTSSRLIRVQKIHTSAKRDVHPIFGIILKPLSRVITVIFGRAARKWWRTLPQNKKDLFYEHLKRNKLGYIGGTAIFGASSYFYYQSHITIVPFTRRKRFMMFTSKQLHDLSLFEYEQVVEEYKHQLFHSNHPIPQKVVEITNKLLSKNKDVAQLYNNTWTVTVIDSPIENCFVLASGHIVVFRGMVELTENDHQLANIIAHEMSHAILSHSAEKVSQAYLIDLLMIIPMAIIWCFLPNDGISAVTHWFMLKVVDVLVNLPYSRVLEREADIVGLMLTARACYDVRDASAFWGQVSLYEKLAELRKGKPQTIDWLSTHPSHCERQCMLDDWMPNALKLRSMCQCPELPYLDPRKIVEMLQKKHGIISLDEADESIKSESSRLGTVISNSMK